MLLLPQTLKGKYRVTNRLQSLKLFKFVNKACLGFFLHTCCIGISYIESKWCFLLWIILFMNKLNQFILFLHASFCQKILISFNTCHTGAASSRRPCCVLKNVIVLAVESPAATLNRNGISVCRGGIA